MASLWRRTLLYLGLGPDDEYEDGPSDERAPAAGPRAASIDLDEPRPSASVRPLPRERERVPAGRARDRNGDGEDASDGGPLARPRAVVRPLPRPPAKPFTVSPVSFNDAQEVADRYLAGTPVIMNLQEADRDLSRRLVDFASGLCYGLRGSMERVTNGVYLLTPSDVEVSAEERLRLSEHA